MAFSNKPFNEAEFNPRSIVGMLMYLATNTSIDTAPAVSQSADLQLQPRSHTVMQSREFCNI